MDNSSGRDEFNAGSDSAKHHRRGTASEQHDKTILDRTPAPTPSAQVVRDLAPTNAKGSAVR